MSNQPPPPGDQPYGNQPPGNQPYGNQPPGNQPYGSQPPGNQPPGQPYGNQPPPGYQGGYQQEQPRGGPGLAIAALIAGILALLSGWTVIIGVPFILLGLILGFIALSRARKGRATGRGMAITGIVLSLLGLVSAVLVAVLVGSVFDEAQNLVECVEDAGDDQAAIEQCERDFEDEVTN